MFSKKKKTDRVVILVIRKKMSNDSVLFVIEILLVSS